MVREKLWYSYSVACKRFKEQIKYIKKSIIFHIFKIDYVTICIMFYLMYIPKNIEHVKNFQTLDCKNFALDPKKVCPPWYTVSFKTISDAILTYGIKVCLSFKI